MFSIDWDRRFDKINLHTDISELSAERILKEFGSPDVIWASPDCTSYSVAAISAHRRLNAVGSLEPISEYAKFCDKTNCHVLELIKALNPKVFFIENPRGGLRKMNFMRDIPRFTVTYCQYGDTRQKPTDIWTNHPNPDFKPACKPGATCHTAAPRGSKTGTQALADSELRSVIPAALCEHIVDICERIM